jgi:hypothetical protein
MYSTRTVFGPFHDVEIKVRTVCAAHTYVGVTRIWGKVDPLVVRVGMC